MYQIKEIDLWIFLITDNIIKLIILFLYFTLKKYIFV
jgi:hypothetical protein